MNKTKFKWILFLAVFLSTEVFAQELTKALTFIESNGSSVSSRTNTVLKNSLGEYYITISPTTCDTIFIDDVKFTCEDFPEYDLVEYSGIQFIVKLTPELEVDTFIRIKGLDKYGNNSDLKFTITDSLVFMSYRFRGYDEKYTLFGEELFLHDSLDRGGIVKFDKDLNFIDRPLILKKPIDYIACNDSVLVYLSHFDEDIERNEHFEVINGDTLWANYTFWPDEFPLYPDGRLPYSVVYNYVQDSIISYWKYSDESYFEAYDMKLDSKGTVITSTNAVLFDPDVEGQVNRRHLMRYNLDGTRDKLTIINTEHYLINVHKDDSYLVYGVVGNNYKVVFGDTITNHLDSIGTTATGNRFLMKFDSNGEHLWNYHIEGTGKSRTIIYFSEGPNYITTLWSISECNVVIQGNNYWFDEFTYVVINLDKETGEVISHKIQYNSDPLKYMLVYYTETFEEKDKIRILAFLKYESELFGLAETIESKNGTVFLEGKLSFLTKVINPEFQQLNFEILGNPVGADEILRIKHSIHDNLNFEIYDLNGLIYLSGSLTDYPESELNLSLLHSGAYVIRCYNKEGSSGSKIFIKN